MLNCSPTDALKSLRGSNTCLVSPRKSKVIQEKAKEYQKWTEKLLEHSTSQPWQSVTIRVRVTFHNKCGLQCMDMKILSI